MLIHGTHCSTSGIDLLINPTNRLIHNMNLLINGIIPLISIELVAEGLAPSPSIN